MRIFLTGVAGFIGFHAAKALLRQGHEIVGIDSINAYYDPALKRARLALLEPLKGFSFVEGDIADMAILHQVTSAETFDIVVHFAAQAGVRYALEDPASYTRSNLVGHHNMLECARRQRRLSHFIYASSSSVYGNDTTPPFSEDARADRPVSYYGATKRAGELLSHSYAELYGLRQTGLRFFTVYGTWGRPDMAYWLFTQSILEDKPIKVFGEGRLKRDFTWIDDIVSAIVRVIETPFTDEPGRAPHRLYNLGNSHPEDVSGLIATIEQATKKKAKLDYAAGPAGDVKETYADITRAARDFGFKPDTSLADGIPRFVEWYRKYTGR